LPRKRAVTILLFPIFAFIFIIGWAMNIVGEPKASTKHGSRTNVKTAKKEQDLETGIVAELAEEQELIVE
jgi:hypothetical protein